MAKRPKKDQKQKNKKAPNSVMEKTPQMPIDTTNKWLSDGKAALVVLFAAIAAHFIFSTMSDGFYQHDESGHFANMKSFWHDPNKIMGNWPKTGYKLIFVVPSLLGITFVKFLNCVMAGLAGFFSYKIAKHLGSNIAILAGILVATQPMFFSIAFRNYSEITTAALLGLGVWMHYKGRLNLATFLLAYICTIRQELLPLLAAYGLFLIKEKQFLAILAGAIPILFINTWGWINSGDPLYLLSSMIGKSEALKNQYPKQGTWHYFQTAEAIFGVILLMLTTVYFTTRSKTKKVHWPVVIPAMYFFLIHVIFNSKTLNIGPGTGGNLRYLTVISPMLAVMGTLAIEAYKDTEKKVISIIGMVLILLVVAVNHTYENNGIMLTTVRNWMPLIFGALTLGSMLLLGRKNVKDLFLAGAIGLLAIVYSPIAAKYFPITPEDSAMKELAEWYKEQVKYGESKNSGDVMKDTPVFFDHNLFAYFNNKSRLDFVGEGQSTNREHIESAPIGSIFIWDTHYGYRPERRPTAVRDTYFKDRPGSFKLLKNIISTDNRFYVSAYKKIGEQDSANEEILRLINTNKLEEAEAKINAALSKKEDAQLHHLKGKVLSAQKKYFPAIESFSSSIQMNPNFDEVYYDRATAYFSVNKTGEALGDVNKYLSLNQNNANGYYLKGNISYMMGKFEDALEAYKVANNMMPNNKQIMFNLGMTHVGLKNMSSACQALKISYQLGLKKARDQIEKYCR